MMCGLLRLASGENSAPWRVTRGFAGSNSVEAEIRLAVLGWGVQLENRNEEQLGGKQSNPKR
jgi:hypothetical protein